METRGKTHAEFRAEVTEMMAKHETSLNQVNTNYDNLNAMMQTVMGELHSLRVSSHSPRHQLDENPFYHGKSSNMGNDSNRPQLKLPFPRFNGEDPQGWIYKAEQYFDF